MSVGTDDAWHAFLAQDRKPEQIHAPAALRRWIAALPVLRWDLGAAFAHEAGYATLTWWCGELGLRGRPEQVREMVDAAFRDLDFTRAPEGDAWTFYRQASGTLTEVALEGPRRWTGGRETACGLRVRWTVKAVTASPSPTVAEVLREFPWLADARVDRAPVDAVASLPTAEVSFGGTWSRYFTWTVTVGAADPASATRAPSAGALGADAPAEDPTLQSIDRALRDCGYVLQPGDEREYRRENSGSYAWLEGPDASRRITLRIQPES